MTVKGPFSADVDPAAYLDAAVSLHGEAENNLRMSTRLGKPDDLCASRSGMHDNQYFEIFPKGGVIDYFAQQLPKIPNMSLNFDMAAPDAPDNTPSSPGPKAKG